MVYDAHTGAAKQSPPGLYRFAGASAKAEGTGRRDVASPAEAGHYVERGAGQYVTRRSWLRWAGELSLAAAASAALPPGVLAQPAGGKDPRLIVRSVRPPDYETPVALLNGFITPTSVFFVRSHMTVPSVDEGAWTLAVDGEVAMPLTMAVADIRRLPSISVTATIECAGNGRAFFDPSVAGIQWGKGAVGTARWTGVRLSDLLRRAGVRSSATHVWMAGADRPLGTQPSFIRQAPIAKANHPDTIIAHSMNDQPIPLLHGAPLRAIIPGWEGAYSVKWLNRLTVANQEHDGFWVSSAYRYPSKRVAPGAAVDAKDMIPLTGLVVKSLITSPADGAVIPAGRVTIAGFAWAGEADVVRVDVSTDGGSSWRQARLGDRVKYAWRRFELSLDLQQRQVYTVLSRATDSRGETQPIEPAWNPSGYLWNAPDRIRIEVGS